MMQALLGESLILHGVGSQTPSSRGISDLVEILVRLMQTDPSVSDPINPGNPRTLTLQELIEEMICQTKSCSTLIDGVSSAEDSTPGGFGVLAAKQGAGQELAVSLQKGLGRSMKCFAGFGA